MSLAIGGAHASDTCSMEAIKVYVSGGWTPAQIKEVCPDFGSNVGPKVKREVLTFPASSPLCPTKQSGDDDLAGTVTIRTQVELQHDTKILRSLTKVSFEDTETGNSATVATREWKETLYTAPSGWIIIGIDSEKTGQDTFEDKSNSPNTHSPQGNFFTSLTSVGSREGLDDLTACSDTNAHVKYTLGPVIVVLQAE